jgi:MutS domain V
MTSQIPPDASSPPATAWGDFFNSIASAFQLRVEPTLDWWFSPADVARYHDHVVNQHVLTGGHSLDNQTWHDLALGDYLQRLTEQTSVFGQQMLFHRLHAGSHGLASTSDGSSTLRIKSLLADDKMRDQLKATLKPLREVDTEIVTLLFTRAVLSLPVWIKFVWLLPILLIASFGGLFFSLYSLVGVVSAIGLIMAVQHIMYVRLKEWENESLSLKRLLLVATMLGGHAFALTSSFADSQAKASRIHRRISRSPALDFLPGAAEYADWFLLSNVRHYQKCLNIIAEERHFLQLCFERVAAIESDIAVATHVLTLNNFCWAGESTQNQIALDDMVHPMLANAIPLTIRLNGKGVLITGQNGIGKSTLLKKIGLNIVAGRAFGFCYAREAVITSSSVMPLYASFNNEDSLNNGESLYIAELRRAKEMLDASQKASRAICLIDEIFRGTNHIEAVAAASAVLNALCMRALVVVSSHHVVLAPLLESTLDPVFLDTQDGDIATLRLHAGVLTKTNGVALLRANGFDDQINADAHAVLAWLNQYLAYPTKAPHLLRTV